MEKQSLRFANRHLTPNQLDASLIASALNNPLNAPPSTSPPSLSPSQDDEDISLFVQQNQALLRPIGLIPCAKREGSTRLFYENLNGMPPHVSGNTKLEKTMGIIDDMEIDVFAYNEHKINFAHPENRRSGLSKLFNGGETLTRSTGGNFSHPIAKSLGRRMEGGTGMTAYGELASLARSDLSGMDSAGLARWSYMTFSGKEGHVTTIIVGYNPCRTSPSQPSTSYQLQRTYWTVAKRDHTCPRTKFKEDLISQLVTWRLEGRRLILCLDANDNVYTGPLGRALVSHPDLDLREATLTSTGTHLTATHFRGSRPIDAIWTTPDVDIVNVCAMPIGYGAGDHRAFILDVTTRSLVGTDPQPIKRPAARRLNTKIPRCSDSYIQTLETQLLHHKIIPKLQCLSTSSHSTPVLQEKLDAIDTTVSQLMHHAERQCRKLKSGRIPFSPEASLWIKRTLCYRALLRYWAGKIKNRGNLVRQARRCQIKDPLTLSVHTIRDRLQECKKRCQFFTKHGHRHRRSHLNTRLHEAKDRGDELAERRILQIIQGERDRAFWRRLNWALGKRQGSSVREVHVEEQDGSITEYSSQSDVQNIIWEKIHRERYHMAEEAPICQGRLRGAFGYNAATPSGEAVLEGSYSLLPDEHTGTKLLFDAIAKIRQQIPPNSIHQIISRTDWQYTWRHKHEATSSSQSGLHFGHYVSGASSDLISDIHALKTSLALHHGIALSRWKKGLCVMIEKSPGVKLLSKLRAILLMEADFNAANKIIFGQRMLDNVRRYKLMPDEIFSEKQRMAEDGILSKVLFYDISRQLRAPAGLASVDAANCYDRVAHAVVSLVFRAVGAQLPMTLTMLTAIQQMQFFLRTSFGDSDRAVGARIHLSTQGFMQGNGASPAGWTVVSISILMAHKSQGHGASFLCPVSNTCKDLACILYVDDTDLLQLSHSEDATVTDAHSALQSSITSWGNLLIATGGALKPQKCFYYLIGYNWGPQGKWTYAAPATTSSLQVTVPQPDGSQVEIQQLSVTTPSTTLGGATTPAGTQASLVVMRDKAISWASQARNSGLRPRDFHISVNRKFWPKIKYGLSANTAKFQDLVSAMHKPYFWMAPIGGLIRSARRELRSLDTGFYGLGYPHWGIEALIEAYRKFYTHYGTTSVLGVQLQMSLELLICEVGISDQPFILSYKKYGDYATDSFCKSLWEKLDHFDCRLFLNHTLFRLPREHDRWMMTAFEQAGFSPAECRSLNLVRLHQQVLYESDIFEANGRSVNPKYLTPRQTGTRWSSYRFGKQNPPPASFRLWKDAISQLTPGGRRNPKLGSFLQQPNAIWPCRYDQEEDVILQQSIGFWELFRRQDSTRHARNSPYLLVGRTNPPTDLLPLCSTRPTRNNQLSVTSHTPAPPTPHTSNHFHEVLASWSHNHWWNGLKYSGSGTWIYQSIQQGSLVCVSDGSYIREMHPLVCSAAVIMECKDSHQRLSFSTTDVSSSSNAFRGELIGLLAIHLILHSIHKAQPELTGSVKIYSDCTGALRTISSLPSSGIPPKWKHADLLKVMSTHGRSHPFSLSYHHVKAHQDDSTVWHKLERVSQLNCACDSEAKRMIMEYLPTPQASCAFPLEPLVMIIGNQKITSDSDSNLRYFAHKQEAKSLFIKLSILSSEAFEEVAWPDVHSTLSKLPKMFQLFAGKQVFGVSAVLGNLSKQKEFAHLGEKCPNCTSCKETTSHLLHCREIGRIKCLTMMIRHVSNWMETVHTSPELADLITDYLSSKGTLLHHHQPTQILPQYSAFIQSQDTIGWSRMMEGMVSKELLMLDPIDVLGPACKISQTEWVHTLIRKLIEAIHGVWIYRNITMHDNIAGHVATKAKEQLIHEIEKQIELGGEGLAEQDKWMIEIDPQSLEASSGVRESYWLLAIQTARARLNLAHQTD